MVAQVGIPLWQFDDATERDNTGSDLGLEVGDIGYVKGQALYICGSAGSGASTWSALTVQSLDFKASVRAAATGALPANTRTGNILLADANGALPAIDGVSLALGDSVLVPFEGLGENNGVYEVTDLGSGGTQWELTRRADADSDEEVSNGLVVYVSEGATYGGTNALLVTLDPITVNTTALTFDFNSVDTPDWVEFQPQSANPGAIATNTLYQDDGTNYPAGTLVWSNAMHIEGGLTLAGAALTDADAGYDDIVVGDATATSRGLTFHSTGSVYSGLAWNDGLNLFDGRIDYNGVGFRFRMNNANRLTMDGNGIFPVAGQTLDLADATTPFVDIHGTTLYLAGADVADGIAGANDIVVGDDAGDYGVTLAVGATGTGGFMIGNGGATRGGIEYDTPDSSLYLTSVSGRRVQLTSASFRPTATATYDLGTTGRRWLDVFGTTLYLAGAASGDAVAGADNLIIGDGLADAGLTVFMGAGNLARVSFSDGTNLSDGQIRYDGVDFVFRTNNSDSYEMEGTEFKPLSGTPSLGTAANPWGDVHGTTLYLAGATSATPSSNAPNLVIGTTAESVAGITVQTSITGTGSLIFNDADGLTLGAVKYAHNVNELSLFAAGQQRVSLSSTAIWSETGGQISLGTSADPWGTAYLGASGGASAHEILGASMSFADVTTNLANKTFYLTARPYTNTDGDWTFLSTQGQVAANILYLGGAGGDGATNISFYTSSAVNTAGSLKGAISGAGAWTIGADGGGQIHRMYGSSLVMRNVDTTATQKDFRLLGQPYTTAEGSFMWAGYSGNVSNNVARFGGDSGNDSATLIEFYTATALNTSGTVRGQISNTGQWQIGTEGGGSTHIIRGAGMTGRDNATDLTNKVFNFRADPYTNAEGSWIALRTEATSADNTLRLGGQSATDSATRIVFMSAPALDSSGVDHGILDSSGLWTFGRGSSLKSAAVEIHGEDLALVLTDQDTNLADKNIRVGTVHYTNAEEPAAVFYAQNTSGTNTLRFGGGTSLMNAATRIEWYTGATTTTTTGQLRGSINNAGAWTIGTLAGGQQHFVNGDSLAVRDNLTDVTNKEFEFYGSAYANAQGQWMFAGFFSNSTSNQALVGGRTTANSATQINFYTATALNTNGTLRGQIDSAGLFSWNGDMTLDSGSPQLTVGSGGSLIFDVNGVLQSGNPVTDTTNKTMRWGALPYNLAHGTWWAWRTASTLTANTLQLGGEVSNDGATHIQFYTATAVNTAPTLRGIIDNAGLFSWNGDLTLDSASPTLTVGDGTGTPDLVMNAQAAGASNIYLQEGGSNYWTIRKESGDDLVFRRLNTSAENVLVLHEGTGNVTITNALLLAGAGASDGPAGADDLVVGDGTSDFGISIFGSGTGTSTLNFTDTSGSTVGALRYDHNNTIMEFVVEGTQELILSNTQLSPSTDGGLGLGKTDNPLASGWTSLVLEERADHVGAPTATRAEMWLRNDAPNTLVFTDDAGGDHPISLMELLTFQAEGAQIPGGGLGASVAGGASGIGGRTVVSYSPTADQEAYWIVAMPRDYTGGGFTVRIRYSGNTGFLAADTIRWNVGFERHSDDISMTSVTTTDTASDDTPGTAYGTDDLRIFDIAVTGANDGGIVGGDGFLFKLERLGAHGNDDYADTAHVFSVSIIQDP